MLWIYFLPLGTAFTLVIFHPSPSLVNSQLITPSNRHSFFVFDPKSFMYDFPSQLFDDLVSSGKCAADGQFLLGLLDGFSLRIGDVLWKVDLRSTPVAKPASRRVLKLAFGAYHIPGFLCLVGTRISIAWEIVNLEGGEGADFSLPMLACSLATRCLPFSGGAWTCALRPKGHTLLDSPTIGSPRKSAEIRSSAQNQIYSGIVDSAEFLNFHCAFTVPYEFSDEILNFFKEKRAASLDNKRK